MLKTEAAGSPRPFSYTTGKSPSPNDSDVYGVVAQLSEDTIRCSAAFTGLLAFRPHEVSEDRWGELVQAHDDLRRWQRTSLDLLAASVTGDAAPTFAASLLDHLPNYLGWGHHSSLPYANLRPPLFFRTDQAENGKILEVQCPGSLWGVHEILRDFYIGRHERSALRIPSLSAAFTRQLRCLLGERPVVHHLLDNASHPAGERYFIQRARASASYFGFDPDVRPRDCNLVRSHDFVSLLSENFASDRLRKVHAGNCVYDLPPIALFDQKLLVALPFWDLTREHFDNRVRALFPYTTVLTPEGVRLETGHWLSVEQFCKLPRRQRAYFLKYAGSDVSRNWGSRAVFHLGKLSREACHGYLLRALERFHTGERWIIQIAQPSESEVTYFSRSGRIIMTRAHSKHSTFFGPAGPLAVLMMAESFYKVHGSTDTITSVGALSASLVGAEARS